jgi:hypothetical protein
MKEKGQLQAGPKIAERGKAAGARTERERAYIAAVGKLYSDFDRTPQQGRFIAYRAAMQQIAGKYPADVEGQIFYALALAASEEPTDKTYAGSRKKILILRNKGRCFRLRFE